MALDNLAEINVVGSGLGGKLLGIVGTIFNIIIVLFIMGAFAGLFYLLMRFLTYNVSVELYERKGDTLAYFGDDRIKKKTEKGVSYMAFLQNRGESFKHRKFPDSKFLIKKRFFGSKLKLIISGDDIIPASITCSNVNEIDLHAMPSHQKVDYIQRADKIQEDYQKKNTTAQLMTLVVGVTLVGILIFGLFVVWQSNVSANEMTRALSADVTTAVKALAGCASSLPAAP